ncbi:MAG: hypothetical protein QOK71_10540 [Nitrososphaeraceae archaeon]|nr:hypothetical protein [Nitrososphaeraceae archaeon]
MQIHIMSLKVLSTIFALSIYFVIFSSLYSDSNLFSVEAQPSTISDHEFHGYLEQMIGHLDASILNVQNNNSVLAVAHALHPIEEILDVINSRLIQTNETLAKDFSSKLNKYVQTVRSDNLNKIIIEKRELEKLLSNALDQSISLEKRTNRDHILNVTAELITIASEEYAESMSQGNIINFLEYQDGQQFFQRSISLLNKSQAYLSENDKNYLTGLNKLKKGMDSKIDPSEIDMNVKDMLCKIKKELYC